jgi:hypothetical protein
VLLAPSAGGHHLEHQPVGVELLSQLRELAHLAREPIDAVDEQQIDPAVTGEIERGL